MNEWRELLRQTHPQFQHVQSVEVTEVEEDKMPEKKSVPTEIEWISPIHKLQNKIGKIPDKMGFKIGEAADYVGVKQYVLRYWETEFEVLKPKKSKNGQRMYTKKDVEVALLIKKLLHEDRFSIEGARSALKRLKKQVKDREKPTVEQQASQESAIDTAKELLRSIRRAKMNLHL